MFNLNQGNLKKVQINGSKNEPFVKKEGVYNIIGEENQISKLKSESFYLLSFAIWLNPASIRSNWELNYGSDGFFALFSFVILFGQMIVLFDLSYEEELARYKTKSKVCIKLIHYFNLILFNNFFYFNIFFINNIFILTF
jgi:hypothetical protein